MQLRAGTSGYQYKAWRGRFYPERFPEPRMLEFYGEHLPTVEVNNTFYRMPKREVMTRWAEQVPPAFRFAIKAPQRITHRLRLRACDEPITYLFETLAALGDRLGPVLFQLPPNFKQDLARLEAFVSLLPDGVATAFEFRHASWFDEQVYALLRARGSALCIADTDESDLEAAWPVTADFGYLRLRRDGYAPEQIDRIAARIRTQPWQDVFAYLKHEDVGPELAQALMAA